MLAAIGIGWVLAAIAALALVALTAVWWIPKRQAKAWRDAGVAPGELAQLENSARGTVVQLVGGVALILTFVATWAQLADTRRTSERTLELAAGQQQSEGFSRAVEQLGSRSQISRVAAMASLGAVLRGPVQADREPALQVLLSYLRTAHPAGHWSMDFERPPRDCSRPDKPSGGPPPARPQPDMQAAMAVVIAYGGLGARLHDLSHLDLTAVDAESANLSGARLNATVLGDARLDRVRLDHAELVEARLHRACLRDASFVEASASGLALVGSDLSAADFAGADLSYGNLQSAGLEGASFRSADLRGASLVGAALRDATFAGADLAGADLSKTGVTRQQLSGAETDDCTRLPWRLHVPERCAPTGSIG